MKNNLKMNLFLIILILVLLILLILIVSKKDNFYNNDYLYIKNNLVSEIKKNNSIMV
jgi:TM2 domain-containing membrane protein YozV